MPVMVVDGRLRLKRSSSKLFMSSVHPGSASVPTQIGAPWLTHQCIVEPSLYDASSTWRASLSTHSVPAAVGVLNGELAENGRSPTFHVVGAPDDAVAIGAGALAGVTPGFAESVEAGVRSG